MTKQAEIQVANYMNAIKGLNLSAELVKAGIEAIIAACK